MSSESRIVLGVTGSIAAYKAAELTRRLGEADCAVSIMMTESATKFVGPLTFQALSGNPVVRGRLESLPPEAFQHIDLVRDADLVLIAPCTANVMAKIAHGIADDVVTATVLASRAPLMLAPAMNDGMWENAATQANVKTLRERGVTLLEVGHGALACGMVGAGRMMEPEAIVEAVRTALAS